MDNTMMAFPLVLPRLLDRALTLYPDREIVSRLADHSLHRYSYREMHGRTLALARALRTAGLGHGDRVATLMWNHYRHLEAYFGIPGAGGVVHTLNLRLHPDDLAYIVNHAGDRFLIVDDVLWPLFERFRDKISLERVFVARLSDAALPEGAEDYESLIDSGPGDFAWPDLGELEPAAMCYTSGTTGRPKGVVYSHRAMVLHTMCLGMVDGLGLSQSDAIMPIVPMFHVNGWNLPYVSALVGAKQVLPGPHLDPESLLDLLAREDVTFTGAVPTLWLGMVEALRREPGRWRLSPRLRLVVGGAAPPESLIRDLDDLGLAPIHGWGMTETTAGATMSHVKSHLRAQPTDALTHLRAERTLPLPFVETRVVSEEGIAPWDGETMGEFQIRAPWVAASYHDDAEAGDRWTEDGWFRTGDVANIDPEGYVKICDRTKDLIRSGGEWISSQDLENALMGHPAVNEAAVIAVAHAKWGERPLAAVVARDGDVVTPEALRAHLAGRFAKWWLPDAIVFVDESPRTSTGKFLTTALREQFKDWRWDG